MPFLLLVVLNLPFDVFKKRVAFWLTGELLLFQILASGSGYWFPWNICPDRWGIFFGFKLSPDNLSLIMLFTIGLTALVSLLTAAGTLQSEKQRFNFVNLLLIALAGMNTIVLVSDLFSLYLFVEVTALALFILIALDKGKAAIEGTFKYLILSAVAGVFMLTAIAFFLLTCGGVSFNALGAADGGNFFFKLALGLFLCGLLIKSGLVPFHGWLPDAYSSAPASVSVLLAGIVTKISGVYVLLRLYGQVFTVSASLQNTLLTLGGVSIVVGACAALTQDDFKRMLAFSSISQIGYIVLGLGCGTPLGFAGAVFHFFNHAIFKSLLFVNAASLEKQAGTTDMNRLGSFGAKMPLTGLTSLIGLLSTAGVPPLAGFWSKLVIVVALFNAGRFGWASCALLASVLTLAYFLSFERRVFFGKMEPPTAKITKTPGPIAFAEILLAALTLVGGLGFIFIIRSGVWS